MRAYLEVVYIIQINCIDHVSERRIVIIYSAYVKYRKIAYSMQIEDLT